MPRAAQLEAALGRQRAQCGNLTEAARGAEQRIAALERQVAELAAALAAHQADDRRHTGKLGGVL